MFPNIYPEGVLRATCLLPAQSWILYIYNLPITPSFPLLLRGDNPTTKCVSSRALRYFRYLSWPMWLLPRTLRALRNRRMAIRSVSPLSPLSNLFSSGISFVRYAVRRGAPPQNRDQLAVLAPGRLPARTHLQRE